MAAFHIILWDFSLIDLLLGGCHRHKYLTHNAQLVARQGYALGVVARAGANYSARTLLLGEAAYLVVCSAYLVGAHHLQILTL